MRRFARGSVLVVLCVFFGGLVAGPAAATPVCTDGFRGGPPLAACGNRIFPEAAVARGYVQYSPTPYGFSEYIHGLDYLQRQYPRWISVTTLEEATGNPHAVSVGPDGIRPDDPRDLGDGRQILVVKITDHQVPDEGKETLLFSLSVHGNERGGLEGGLRTAEDLAMGAANPTGEWGTIVDGVDNYTSTTGRTPKFNSYKVADVLAKEAVYLVDFNIDGWASGEVNNGQLPGCYNRGNNAGATQPGGLPSFVCAELTGTDLNRQMPTVGSINTSRNPLAEPEMKYGTEFMHKVAEEGVNGKMAYGADIHGELNSRAYIDIMYPAGEFDSVAHRRLMAIAERTKSVVDATLYAGIQDEIESATGGNEGEGVEDMGIPVANTIPTMPAHWATVWDTLGYTDTGFIGDYMATDLGVTGMDYEIMFNHTVPERVWNVYLQENHINGSRAIIKTAMAYALTQAQEFNAENVSVPTGGRAGYVHNPDTVTDTDENGPGRLAGPRGDGLSQNGKPVAQRPYDVTNQKWFTDTSKLMGDEPFLPLLSGDIAADPATLDAVDSLVLADITLPADPLGRAVDRAAYFANIKSWVERGGNLVLTDRGLHALVDLGVVASGKTTDIKVYQPYSDLTDRTHPMAQGLRGNARQLVEAAPLGYGIGNTASPMTTVDQAAFTGAGGKVVGTTGTNRVSVGQLPLGSGQIRVVGGALPTPTEALDHRYGLRNYALTYSGLFIMENSIRHDASGLGETPVSADAYEVPSGDGVPKPVDGTAMFVGLGLLGFAGGVHRRRVVRA